MSHKFPGGKKVKNIFSYIGVLSALILIFITVNVYAEKPFGITIEQQALDILLMASKRISEVRSASNLEQVISINAKITVPGISLPVGLQGQKLPNTYWAHIEIFRALSDKKCPLKININLTTDFGQIRFLTTDCGNERTSVAALTDEKIYTNINILQFFPDNIMMPDDQGGLFTMINLLGGVPFGALLQAPSSGGVSPDISFVQYLEPANQHVVIRYRGKDETPAGTVHVISLLSTGAAKYLQSMKVWILEDTYDIYQITLEDERGTEFFIVFDDVNLNPIFPEDIFTTANMGTETSLMEFFALLSLKSSLVTINEMPVVLDLYADSSMVARTGTVFISSDGFSLQDKENELIPQIEYKSPSGPWTPIKTTEYAGIPPLGHWNGIFAPDESAELGMYSFRVRYTNKSGRSSQWMEALNLVRVLPPPPRIVSINPMNHQTKVPTTTRVSVSFNMPMDKNSVEKNFYMNSDYGRLIKGTFTWDKNTIIFSPSEELEYNRVYYVRITGEAKDAQGYGLDGDYNVVSTGTPFDDFIWTFKTLPANPNLKFEIVANPIYIGDIFEVKIMARSMVEMYKFNLKVTFDPKILKVEKVEKISFSLWQPKPKNIQEVDLWKEPIIDNTKGILNIACDSTRTNGVSGSGYIASIIFKGIGKGNSSLNFVDISVTDKKGNSIKTEIRSSEVQVIDFHPQDANRDGVVDIRDFAIIASRDTHDFAAPKVEKFELGQNYPNPFNPETWIPFKLAKPSNVTINIYKSNGEIVKRLELGYRESGFYTGKTKAAFWDGTDQTGEKVSSGVYFYTIQADGFTATKKMLLNK